MLKLHVLASGSKGNAAIIENADTGAGVLIDCGICKRDVQERATEADFDTTRIHAVIVSHDHTDHTKGLGVVLRALAKQNVHPTVFASRAVLAASSDLRDALDTSGAPYEELACTHKFTVAGIDVTTFETSHDAAQSFGFRFSCGSGNKNDAIGFMTDTGVLTEEAAQALQYVRILALEANHDLDMLMGGPYPYPLKKRISSARGHLSNDQSAQALFELATTLGGSMLEHVVAMHISQHNNTYDLAHASLTQALSRASHHAKVHVAKQDSLLSVY